MLRRAENVTLSRTLFGRVTVQVDKKQYPLKRRPTKEQWTADRARQQSEPVLVLSTTNRNLWQFQNRFYWGSNDLNASQVARGVNSDSEDSRRPRGLIGWLKEVPRLLEFSWLYVIPFICILGVVVILIYVSQLPSGVRWGACATALVIGSSAFLAGGFIGFLFGVPRTVTIQGSTPSTAVTQYQGNTNLEQVSDWLTKIIVGVGLVQIGRIIPALSEFAESMKAPLGGQASSGAFGLGLAIANALMGFFFFYLWARSIFLRELEESSENQTNS